MAAPTPRADHLTDGNPIGNVTFTFEEQTTASVALYSMSLFCIVFGAMRSLNYVKRHISKKRLIETSVTVSEAKSFPFSASAVLFGLYVFFKPDGRQWLCGSISYYVGSRVPAIAVFVNRTLLPSEGNSTGYLTTKLATQFPEAYEYYRTSADYVFSFKKETVMYGLLLLLCFEGCVALAAILKPLFQFVLRRVPVGDRWPRRNIPTLIGVKKGKKEMDEGDIEDASKKDSEYVFKIEFDSHDLIAILICLSVGVSHIYKRHWITNNILGIAFSIYGIENLHLSSFKAGTWLLAGLFIYDIFWVFATDVMTSVAKGIDAPILLQFPQDIYRNGWKDASKYSMLGLGDIVIPGVFIALLKRFDERITGKKEGKKGEVLPGRYYFPLTCVAYALGLLITMAVMHHFKAAQPALLYLVPCCLFIPLLLALVRGEVSELWNYCEEHLIEKKDTHDKKKVDAAKKNN